MVLRTSSVQAQWWVCSKREGPLFCRTGVSAGRRSKADQTKCVVSSNILMHSTANITLQWFLYHINSIVTGYTWTISDIRGKGIYNAISAWQSRVIVHLNVEFFSGPFNYVHPRACLSVRQFSKRFAGHQINKLVYPCSKELFVFLFWLISFRCIHSNAWKHGKNFS